MPIYEYRCDNGHTLEVLQRISDDPLASCTACHAPVQRVFHPVAVHFKGSGFYTTDYARKAPKDSDDAKSKAGSDDSGSGASDSSKSSSSSSNSDGSQAQSKSGSSESKPAKS